MIRLLCLDLETTGVDPLEDRIVTYSVIGINGDGQTALKRSGLVNPGIPIPDGAAKVHGVTTEMAQAEGEDPTTALSHISNAINYAIQSSTIVCAFNARFDLTMIAAELERHGMKPVDLSSIYVIDPLIIDKEIDRYRKGSRTLTAVSKHYGIQLDDAHTAEADALAAGLTAQAILSRHPQLLADGIDELHNNQIKWAADQARSLQTHFRKKDPTAVVEPRWPFYTAMKEEVNEPTPLF